MTVLIKNTQGLLKLDRRRLRSIAEELLAYSGLQGRDLNILLTDNKGIARLNKKCFGRDKATNVISFSYLDGFPNESVGDIIISVEQAKMEADKGAIPFYARLCALMVHGLVHILGYDHERGGKEARRMKYRERKLTDHVAQLGAYKEIGL